MITKTITYEDFEGEERTREFYFSMNQVEFTKLNNEVPGGLEKRIQVITEDKDEGALLRLIDLLVSRSYGEKDDDGRFTKIGSNGRPLYEKFINTDAYDKLIIELIQKEDNIVGFLTGIMPKGVQLKINEEYRKRQAESAAETPALSVVKESDS